MKRSALQGIYGILPADLGTDDLLHKAEAALEGGLRILQFRDKKSGFKRGLKRAKLLRQLTTTYHATFIINDSIQMATECHADGVHLGRDDVGNIAMIRQQLPDDYILGITCRADARFAKAALEHGADYIAFGAVFASASKPDVPVIGLPRLAKACQMFPQATVCAIGGIQAQHIDEIVATGASCAAVISALFNGSPEHIKAQTSAMVQAWNNAQAASQ